MIAPTLTPAALPKNWNEFRQLDQQRWAKISSTRTLPEGGGFTSYVAAMYEEKLEGDSIRRYDVRTVAYLQNKQPLLHRLLHGTAPHPMAVNLHNAYAHASAFGFSVPDHSVLWRLDECKDTYSNPKQKNQYVRGSIVVAAEAIKGQMAAVYHPASLEMREACARAMTLALILRDPACLDPANVIDTWRGSFCHVNFSGLKMKDEPQAIIDKVLSNFQQSPQAFNWKSVETLLQYAEDNFCAYGKDRRAVYNDEFNSAYLAVSAYKY